MRILLALALVLSVPHQALAARSGARLDPHEMLQKADADHDGRVTREEFRAARSRLFERLDRNHDGQLSGADTPRRLARRSGGGERLRELVQTLDADRDGRLTHREFVEAPGVFDRADRNRDGLVDAQERADLAAALRR